MNSHGLPFKTIAVATDLSDASSAALRYAQSIARTYICTLVVIHVIDPMAYAFPDGAPAFLAANQSAREELNRMEEEALAQGIAIHSVVESGVVCERILQSVHGHHADLLVLGTRASSEAGRLALGTVARQLLARAHFPIMTISPEAAIAMPWAGRCRRVLAATDFSAASVAAVQFAHQITSRQLFALHVARKDCRQDCPNCLERLRYLAPFDESHTVPVEHIFAYGCAGKKIAEFASSLNVDLVVLGSPSVELMEKDLPTSTVLQVISNVGCPVLCVPRNTVLAPGDTLLQASHA